MNWPRGGEVCGLVALAEGAQTCIADASRLMACEVIA